MQDQCQHLTEYKQNDILILMLQFEFLFDGTLGMWNTSSVEFEINYDATGVKLH